MEALTLKHILEALKSMQSSCSELKEDVRKIRSEIRLLAEEGKRRDENQRNFQAKILKLYVKSFDECTEFGVKENPCIYPNEEGRFNQKKSENGGLGDAYSNLSTPSPESKNCKIGKGKMVVAADSMVTGGSNSGKKPRFDETVFQKTTQFGQTFLERAKTMRV